MSTDPAQFDIQIEPIPETHTSGTSPTEIWSPAFHKSTHANLLHPWRENSCTNVL